MAMIFWESFLQINSHSITSAENIKLTAWIKKGWSVHCLPRMASSWKTFLLPNAQQQYLFLHESVTYFTPALLEPGNQAPPQIQGKSCPVKKSFTDNLKSNAVVAIVILQQVFLHSSIFSDCSTKLSCKSSIDEKLRFSYYIFLLSVQFSNLSHQCHIN